MDDFDREDREHKQFIDYFDVSDDPGYQRYIDCSGLSDSDIEQVKKVLSTGRKYF